MEDSIKENGKKIKCMEKEYFIGLMDENTQGKVDRGNLILSRFPIVNKNDVFYDVPYGIYFDDGKQDFSIFPRTIQHAEIQAGNQAVNVFNTQGIWGLDGDDNTRRLRMSKIIRDQIKDKENVILAGDFNVRPDTKTIHNIEKVLKNVFKDELVTTFNMKRKTNPGYATAVVDMIFISHNTAVVSHSCPPVDISDHLPLVCEFNIN